MSRLTETARDLFQLMFYGEKPPSIVPDVLPTPQSTIPEPQQKDFDTQNDTVSVVGMNYAYQELERKPNVELLRSYASKSVWVRAAIDYHRRTLGRSSVELIPIDSTQNATRQDRIARIEIEKLLQMPNLAGESYGKLKEEFIEDYLVVGHGVFYLDLNRDLTVSSIRVIDAARIGFLKKWDGSNVNTPRYIEFADKYGSRIKQYLLHEQVMCLVNRSTSHSKIGFSHVEALHATVIALLKGDEFLTKQTTNPVKSSLISLGEGTTKPQADSFSAQLKNTRDAFAVIHGAKDPKILNFQGTADEMKILDAQEWFVRQVAAIFGMSTAKLKLAVDTSRANTETMSDEDLEAITGELSRIEELENATFIDRYSVLGKPINLKFTYPIMHRKDEKQQSEIAQRQTGNQAWTSTNEARMRTGEKPLDLKEYPYANEPLIRSSAGTLPLSVYYEWVTEFRKNIGKVP